MGTTMMACPSVRDKEPVSPDHI